MTGRLGSVEWSRLNCCRERNPKKFLQNPLKKAGWNRPERSFCFNSWFQALADCQRSKTPSVERLGISGIRMLYSPSSDNFPSLHVTRILVSFFSFGREKKHGKSSGLWSFLVGSVWWPKVWHLDAYSWIDLMIVIFASFLSTSAWVESVSATSSRWKERFSLNAHSSLPKPERLRKWWID